MALAVTSVHHPHLGLLALALNPQRLVGVLDGRGLSMLDNLDIRLGQRLTHLPLRIDDRAQRDGQAVQVVEHLGDAAFAQLVQHQVAHHGIDRRPERARRHTWGKRRSCHMSAACTPEAVLHQLGYVGLHLRKLEDLVSAWVRILAHEGRAALLALLRYQDDSAVHFLRRPRGPLMLRMTGLPAGGAPRGLLRRPLSLLFRAVARRRLGGVARRPGQLLP